MAIKKLSTTKLDKLLKAKQAENVNIIKYEFNDEVVEIAVKNYIGFDATLDIVNSVLSMVFYISDDGEMHYIPQVLDYAKAISYIEYFTNIKPDIGSKRVYALLYGSNLMKDIYEHINQQQHQSIEKAIDSAIAHKLAYLQVDKQSKISDMQRQVAEAADKIDKAAQAFELLSQQFEDVDQKTIQVAFENLAAITSTDLATAVADIRDQK